MCVCMDGPLALGPGDGIQRAIRESDSAGSRHVCAYVMLCLCLYLSVCVEYRQMPGMRPPGMQRRAGDTFQSRRCRREFLRGDTFQCRRCIGEKSYKGIPSSAEVYRREVPRGDTFQCRRCIGEKTYGQTQPSKSGH